MDCGGKIKVERPEARIGWCRRIGDGISWTVPTSLSIAPNGRRPDARVAFVVMALALLLAALRCCGPWPLWPSWRLGLDSGLNLQVGDAKLHYNAMTILHYE